jgi:hypothetical protein
MPSFKIGDLVRITNGAWSNAKGMRDYGKLAEVQNVGGFYAELLVFSDEAAFRQRGNRSGTIETKPINEIAPENVIDRLASLAEDEDA